MDRDPKQPRSRSHNNNNSSNSRDAYNDYHSSNHSTHSSSHSRSSHDRMARRQQRYYDDDDFSVAPSMDQDVKSVVSVSFDDVYQRGRKLGLGAFAVVFVGTHRPTGAEYAVKQIDRETMVWGDRDALQDEIANLKLAREGPNIVQLYEVYEERAFCYLIMELMQGGELLEYIIEKKTFTESEARTSTRCVLNALAYMHDKRVAHRDIKPENLLLTKQKDLNTVKLADFSFAMYVKRKNECRTLCGTPGYLAPEMLERFPAYDVKCDVWSTGCLLFLLIGGYLPFDDEDDEVIFDLTRDGYFEFRPEFFNGVSSGAKELITRMLTVNPKKRISASNALKSDWIVRGDAAVEERQLNVKKLQNLIEGKRKLRAGIATLITANRVKQLNDGFSEYLEKKKEQNAENKIAKRKEQKREERFVEDSLTGQPFEDFYEIGEELGEGGYAFVYRCTHKRTEKTYAVKEVVISKMENGGESTLKDEIAALKMLRGGSHIVRLYDVFYDDDSCFMVMEEMKGGDLLSRIVDKEVYTEREARGVCKVLFEAVLYCHHMKVAHRDIKPENLLLVNEDDDATVKLADFGFAKRVTGDKSLSTLCGTAQYVAPEILDYQVDGYDETCDMWSVGVVTYILLGGYAPFEGPADELAQFIIRGDYEFHDKYWADISESAKDMIAHMLEVDPEHRLTAEGALQCEWMGLDAEHLASKDLGGTRGQLKAQMSSMASDGAEAKKALQALIKTNKFLSLGGIAEQKPGDETKPKIEDLAEDDFEDVYEWGRQIGIGTFSVVHECVHYDTEDLYAVKRIPRVDLWEEDAEALRSEISCLKLATECSCIVQLYEVFDEEDFTYMVQERLMGGYLIDKIIEKECYDEAEGLIVAKRLLTGVAYCHERRIAIRDLKPENVLLVEGSDTRVKITDFGYAKKVLQPNSLTTVCGTEGFVAPEIIEHNPEYDVECDIWSLGVLIYVVLGGYRPFRGEGDECMEKIRYGIFSFHKKYWSHVSDEARSLIKQMLTVDVQDRITAQEALQSPWISTLERKKRAKKKKVAKSRSKSPKNDYY